MESGFIVTTKQTSIIERGPAGSYLRLNYQAMGYSAKALLNEAGFEKVFRKQIPTPSRYGQVHDHCLLTFPNTHVPFNGPGRVTALEIAVKPMDMAGVLYGTSGPRRRCPANPSENPEAHRYQGLCYETLEI
jgi:hypothetical protein